MDFGKAFEALKEGKKVKRSFETNALYTFKENGVLYKRNIDNSTRSASFYWDDIIATDWEIVKDSTPKKTCIAYVKLVIKYEGYPEKEIERQLKNIKLEGFDTTLNYSYIVVDSVVQDIVPMRDDF